MTDVITLINNNVSRTISSSITYLKLNNILVNIWAESVNYKIPILENQVVLSNTNTITVTCLDSPIDTNLTSIAFISSVISDRGVLSTSTFFFTSTGAKLFVN